MSSTPPTPENNSAETPVNAPMPADMKRAFVISITSVTLGVARELLILSLFGISQRNDSLQVYFSVIYTISLLTDAVRLAVLNVLQRLPFVNAAVSILVPGAIFAGLTGVTMLHFMTPASPWVYWMSVIGGWMNLTVVMLVSHRQRSGTFLPAHIINAMPNFLLIPGILIIWLLKLPDVISGIALLACILPFVQTAALLMLRTPAETIARQPIRLRDSSDFVAHAISMIGSMGFQMVFRGVAKDLGPGGLTIISLFIRGYDSLRLIVIDTYVGKKLEGWSTGTVDARLMNMAVSFRGAYWGLTLVSLLVVLFLPSTLAIGILMALGLSAFLVRILYFYINTTSRPQALVWTVAGQDLLAALACYGLALILKKEMALPMIAWFWFLFRPAIQLLFLANLATKIQRELTHESA